VTLSVAFHIYILYYEHAPVGPEAADMVHIYGVRRVTDVLFRVYLNLNDLNGTNLKRSAAEFFSDSVWGALSTIRI